jgi:hypothetical protein
MSDRIRFMDAFAALGAQGVAVSFNLSGAHIVGEDNLADYQRTAKASGLDRWVGAHVGARECGGGYFDGAGVLRYRHNDQPVEEITWSFNHRHPELVDLLVSRFTEQGLDASWPGGYSCVLVRLGGN